MEWDRSPFIKQVGQTCDFQDRIKSPSLVSTLMLCYLLCTCIFARQFWYYILSLLGLANLSPASNESTFADWWEKVCKQVHKSKRRGFKSISKSSPEVSPKSIFFGKTQKHVSNSSPKAPPTFS
jgi:hypothetical protein